MPWVFLFIFRDGVIIGGDVGVEEHSLTMTCNITLYLHYWSGESVLVSETEGGGVVNRYCPRFIKNKLLEKKKI